MHKHLGHATQCLLPEMQKVQQLLQMCMYMYPVPGRGTHALCADSEATLYACVPYAPVVLYAATMIAIPDCNIRYNAQTD